jgi:hypothetical protein
MLSCRGCRLRLLRPPDPRRDKIASLRWPAAERLLTQATRIPSVRQAAGPELRSAVSSRTALASASTTIALSVNRIPLVPFCASNALRVIRGQLRRGFESACFERLRAREDTQDRDRPPARRRRTPLADPPAGPASARTPPNMSRSVIASRHPRARARRDGRGIRPTRPRSGRRTTEAARQSGRDGSRL